MAYQGKLQSGQTIILENQGDQTVIRLSGGGQHQSSSVSTSTWKGQPKVYQTEDGAVVEIKTQDASVFYSIKGGQLQSLNKKPNVDDANCNWSGKSWPGSGSGKP